MQPFARPHHICIVVNDIDRAVQFYEAIGVGPWHDYPPLDQYTTLDAPDHQAFMNLRYRYADLGALQLQLCQPGAGGSPQRAFLDERGEGVFHIGFEVDDVDAAERAASELGLRPLMRGRRDNGSGFDYFDTAEQAGTILLVRQSPAPVDDPAGTITRSSRPVPAAARWSS